MRYAFFDADGRVLTAHNDVAVDKLPAEAVMLTAEQWDRRFDLRLVDGKLIGDPLPLDVEALRAGVLARFPGWEQAERAAGIDHAGHSWLTTPAALQDIRDVLLAGAVPGGQWVTADRQVVPLDFAGLQALWQAITARGAAIYRRRLEMEVEISTMDAEQLAAFVPGWPA